MLPPDKISCHINLKGAFEILQCIKYFILYNFPWPTESWWRISFEKILYCLATIKSLCFSKRFLIFFNGVFSWISDTSRFRSRGLLFLSKIFFSLSLYFKGSVLNKKIKYLLKNPRSSDLFLQWSIINLLNHRQRNI